jgi:sugar phosphate isomerase/epimerase
VKGDGLPMKISMVTDEISGDLETAVELGVAWGIRDFELRGFGTARVPFFSDYQKEIVKETLHAFGARVVAISPGLFKFPYPSASRERFPLSVIDHDLYRHWRDAHSLLRQHMEEVLPASIAYAKELGAGLIIAFSFHRGSRPPGRAPDEVLEALRQAAEEAAAHRLRLAIELEDGFWADTGAHASEVVRSVNHPALGINWDPGNAIVAGDTPYPDGYEAVRGLVWHVHFKDVEQAPQGVYRYAVTGCIDWAGQVRALVRDGYDGYISVETHMRPKVQSAQAVLARLRQLVRLAEEASG